MNSLLAFGFPQGIEWIYILIIILLLFGARKLPELARGLGLGIKEFKKATKEISDEIHQQASDTATDDKKKKDSGNPPDSKG